MLEKKDHVKRIQEITFEAYKSSGRIAALLDQNTGPSEQLSEELERVAAQIEHGAIELRNLCARYQAPLPPVGQKPALEPLNIAGRAECNEFGWLHIQLNALLPNCRFASPLWITDTITRLLDRLERRNGKLPLLEEALLMIDEHCDIAARQVYDQDNKAWKAISNALKGRVVADDEDDNDGQRDADGHGKPRAQHGESLLQRLLGHSRPSEPFFQLIHGISPLSLPRSAF